MDTQFTLLNTTTTSEVRQQNKKCVTTKLPSQNEQQRTFHLPERNRSNSLFQFSTKLTYAPLLKTKKPFIHPSPISLCPSNNNENEFVRLDILEEMSFLSETEDESDNAFCLNISFNDEETLSIEHNNIKSIRTYLKNTFELLCNDNNKTIYKESDAILNSKKIYCKLLTCSSYHIVNESTKCKRQSFWRNSIKQNIMFNPRYNNNDNNNNSFAITSNTSHNNSLSILSILEASVN
jgi:hypothetical protein